jgi:hypothetical protein
MIELKPPQSTDSSRVATGVRPSPLYTELPFGRGVMMAANPKLR